MTLPTASRIMAAALSAAALAALARTAELPPLPAPEFVDAEVSTNMPMPAVERAAGTAFILR